ncbi:MAG: GNAT family N-acetyltransferase [Wolinella sp.]
MQHIRKATSKDAPIAMQIAREAMGDIANVLSGEETEEAVLARLVEYCENPHSRLGYENISLYCDNGEIVGVIVLYLGRDIDKLDLPIINSLKARKIGLQSLECECEADDFYIDSLAVKETHRRQGIAKKLLCHAENLGKKSGAKWLSLLVDCDKISTKKYYEKLGFSDVGERHIGGATYARMVKPLQGI